jgi:hypothetical protein
VRVLLLSPDHFSPPSAVFWSSPDGKLELYVAEDGPEVRAATYTLLHRDPSVAWENVFEWLSERTLQTHRWDAVDVADQTPRAYLMEVRRRNR